MPVSFRRFGRGRRTHQAQAEEPSCAKHQWALHGMLEGYRGVKQLAAHGPAGPSTLIECRETACRAGTFEKRASRDLHGCRFGQPDVVASQRHGRLGQSPRPGPRRRSTPAESAGMAGQRDRGGGDPSARNTVPGARTQGNQRGGSTLPAETDHPLRAQSELQILVSRRPLPVADCPINRPARVNTASPSSRPSACSKPT